MDTIFEKIDNSRELVIELQKGITSREAINPENGGDGEYEKVKYLKETLSSWGFDSIEQYDVPDERVSTGVRPSLVLTINGKSSKRLWLIAHTDVVPPGDLKLWETPPFEAVVKGDKIYGRGTEDNQQSLVSMLVMAKSLLENGVTPEYTLKLLLVADEEVGSEYGIQWLINKGDIFQKEDLILTPDVGDPKGEGIEIVEKSVLWVKFKIFGKQSHGSRPDLGINCARASSHLCIRLDEFNKIYDARDELFDIPFSTFEPTMREGSVQNMNTVPGFELLGFDCRILPVYELDEVIKRMESVAQDIEKEFGVKIELEVMQKLQAPEATPEDAPVVANLKRSIKKVLGRDSRCYGIGGGTVAAYFRIEGFQATLWSTVDNTLHAPNEYSSIKNTLDDAKVFADMALTKAE